jgi:hypothetical protein
MSVIKTLYIKKGQTLNYSIIKDGEIEYSGNKLISGWDNIIINREFFTFTINPTPSDAEVILNCFYDGENYVQEGNSITVPKGAIISWEVSKDEYTTKNGELELLRTYSQDVTLEVVPDDTDFKYTVELDESNKITHVPFDTTESFFEETRDYDIDIYWGDGTHTIIEGSETPSVAMLNHEYQSSGRYQISIRSTANQMPVISFEDNDQLVSLDTNLLYMNTTSLDKFAKSCNNLTTISPELFKNNPQLTSLREAFIATGISEISADILKYCPDLESITYIFGYTNIVSVPVDLFKHNTKLSSVYGAFYKCTQLETIPNDLLKYNVLASDFRKTFSECPKLTINPNVFGDLSTRFVNLGITYVSFVNCFSQSGSSATITGTAPALWDCSFTDTDGNPIRVVSEDCFSGISPSAITNQSIVPLGWGGPGVILTIVPNPSDATVELVADGFEQSGNTIKVDIGTNVTIRVSHSDYITYTGEHTVNTTESLNIPLETKYKLFTINPVPIGATVSLVADGFTQIGNTITVEKGTIVNWTVSLAGYVTQSGADEIIADLTKEVVLVADVVTLTIVPTPADATVVLEADGYTQEGNSITVPSGTEVSWSVSATGYATQSEVLPLTSDTTKNVELTKLNCTISINPNPSDATVVLTADGYTQEGNSITVPYNTTITYEVSATGYITKSASVVANETKTIDVILDSEGGLPESALQDYTYTIDEAGLATVSSYNGSEPDVVLPNVSE